MAVALSCSDEETVEDEYSSLWSTTVSFILLFIASLTYSLTLSLIKVKQKQKIWPIWFILKAIEHWIKFNISYIKL